MNRRWPGEAILRLGGAVGLALTFLLLTISPTGALPPVQGEETGDASFGELTATPNFPATIDFRLTASSSEEIVRAELLFAPQWEETINLIEATMTPGGQLDLTFPLDMYQNYYPPGLDINYRWRLTDAAGRTSLSEERTVLWADTRFAWTQIATEQVSVYFYTGNEAFNRQILDSAQRTIDNLQTQFGVERSRPIRIWVYNSAEEFSGSLEPNSEPWIAGAAYPGRYLIQAVIPDGNQNEIARVIPHEVCHQVLFQATDNPFNLPATWLNEGLAVFYQESDKEGYGVILEGAIREGGLMPLTSLTAAFPFDDTYRLAYAESLSAVQFILDTWGDEAIAEIFAAYQEGISHDEALRRGVGLTTAELDARWKESLGYAGDQPLDDGTGGSLTAGGSGDGDDWLRLSGAAAAGLVVVIAGGAVGVSRRRRRPPESIKLLAA